MTAVWARAIGVMATMALALSSCAGSSPGPAPAAPDAAVGRAPAVPAVEVVTTQTTAAARSTRNILPDLTVDNVAGGTMNLTSLAPSATPVLVWFWAPN